ncbi:MAG TPA: CDP-diacylglycerol--glycerol-3-phosphate 3-phosphatidyltransferase [Mycobacteriales bacterium]|nr:CDP-diacylglycerol--glycerol-3-phosphate 3-phosphatidyltransferase [Mycobacteriales bacterium]
MTATPVTAPPTLSGRRSTALRLSTVPVLNLPNSLTMGRLLVVPVFAVLLLTAGNDADVRVLLWGLFTLACLTDVLDGRLARSRGQVTGFGIMADPIADKALVGTALVGLSLLSEVSWVATLVVLGRELAVTLLRMWVARHGLIPASRGGKLKALTQNVAVALYLLPLTGALAAARGPVLVLAVVATVVTGLDYLAQALRLRAAARH